MCFTMCWCKKKWDQAMSPMQLDSMKKWQEDAMVQRVKDTEEKLNNGEPLTSMDACPYCKRNIWYYCKRGCILGMDKDI